MCKLTFSIGLLFFIQISRVACLLRYSETNTNGKQEDLDMSMCPRIFPKVFWRFVPKGNETAGNYKIKPELHSLQECLDSCCLTKTCNVMFMFSDKCFQVC